MDVGAVRSPAIPLEFSRALRRPAQPTPCLGQHTEEVLSTVLGLSAVDYGKLHDRGIVAG